ncbi:MAG: DNA circularization N-terminal domain-containing protein [Geobacteraceae bacterium]|nr:DNA circularization N-terminal domain-containing protein [Geobacteraceae bacterium]
MSIETETAWLDGIELDIQTLDDHFEKSIVRYEYPFVDGADLEDLGQKAGTVKVRCYFFDDGFRDTYDDHIKLINLLVKKDDFDFIHPKYGQLKGKVESFDSRHDDSERCAEIDFTFVKRGFNAIPASVVDAVDAVAEGAFLDGEEEQLAELANDFLDLGLDVDIQLDPDATLFEQVSGLAADAREVARATDAYIGQLNAAANDITQPINSLTATINYETTLPGRVLGVLTNCVERTARLTDALSKSPASFLSNMKFAFDRLVSVADSLNPVSSKAGSAAHDIIVRHLRIASSRRLAIEAAYIYAADETERQKARKIEKMPSFNPSGRYLSLPAPAPIMNLRELEDSLALVRSSLQAAVNDARNMQSLKNQAVQLLNYISTVKLERDKIIQVEIPSPVPLHLICLKYGLPYNYAERILSINSQLPAPNAISGALLIYTLPGATS